MSAIAARIAAPLPISRTQCSPKKATTATASEIKRNLSSFRMLDIPTGRGSDPDSALQSKAMISHIKQAAT
jgi:hypothetical protein